jgi:hypothetical protein
VLRPFFSVYLVKAISSALEAAHGTAKQGNRTLNICGLRALRRALKYHLPMLHPRGARSAGAGARDHQNRTYQQQASGRTIKFEFKF